MGGAKNCPETPRQKMIGMMYLVLTAMLALNVSTDILSGFTMVDNSLHSSIAASSSQNERLYLEFQAALDKNPAKTQEWYDKAQIVKEKADSLYTYIQNFKDELTIMTDGQGRFSTLKEKGEDPTLNILNNSNFDVTGTYALVQGHGQELKDNVSAYKDFLTGLILERDSAIAKAIRATLATEKGYNAHDRQWVDWEIAVFDGMPIGASMAVLTKMQNDVRTTEGRLVQYLMEQTDAGDFRMNKTEAFIIPTSTNVLVGDSYTARIIVAAQDTTQKPAYYVNGTRINDQGWYEVAATKEGLQTYSGYIALVNPNTNEVSELPFHGEYVVSRPAVTISNTELNVMFSGYDNKFSISVPGVTNDKVRVSVSDANVRRNGNDWIIRPKDNIEQVIVSVTTEIDGRTQSMGKQVFRVKPTPQPDAYFSVGSRMYGSGDGIPKSNLVKSDGKIVVNYGKDGLLNIPFTVKSFIPVIDGNMLPQVNGDHFTKAQLQQIQGLKLGRMVVLQNVIAIDPEGKEKPLKPVMLTVK